MEHNFPFNLAASGTRDRLLLLPFLSILLYVWMYVCIIITIGDEILFFLILPCISLVLAAVSQSLFFCCCVDPSIWIPAGFVAELAGLLAAARLDFLRDSRFFITLCRT